MLAFLLVGAGFTLLGRDGGAYDIVVRQEIAVVLWWVLALAFLAGLLPRTRPDRSGLLVIAGLVLLGIWTAASLGWTSSDERTVTEIARVGAHLGVVVLLATTLGPATWRSALAGLTAGAVALCLIALGSRITHGVFGADVVANAFSGATGTRRLSYPVGYWNALGALAGMTSVLCIAWSAHARRALSRWLALAAMPMAVVVSYLTYSRASLGGTVFGLLVLVAVSRNRWTVVVHGGVALACGFAGILVVRGAPAVAHGTGTAGGGRVGLAVAAACAVAGSVAALSGRLGLDSVRFSPRIARRGVLVGGAVGAVAIVICSVTVLPSAWRSFKQEEQSLSGVDPASRLTNLNSSRYLMYDTAFKTFKAHPLKGTGAGTFEFTFDKVAKGGQFVINAHSLYLEPLSELGIPGLACILLLLGSVIAVLGRALRLAVDPVDRGAVAGATAAVGVFFLGALVDWLWQSTAVAVLMLALVGCVAAANGRPVLRTRAAARVPLVIAALVLCAVELPGLVSTSEVRKSQAAINRGNLASALSHANQAIDSQPWAATPVVQRALVEERQGRLAAARGDLLTAQRREPENWRHPLILARVTAELGRPREALAAYRRARALRPTGRFFAR